MRRTECLILTALCFLLLSSTPPYLRSALDEDCLACHEDPDLKTDQGESLFVDSEKYLDSIHGQAGLSCIDCHSDLKDIEDYPHPEKLKRVSCSDCHEKATEDFDTSIHKQAGEKGFLTVGCSDCHGKHDIKSKENYDSPVFPLNLPRTCEKCHLEKVKTERGTEFIKKYEKSIHYEGLEKAGLSTSSNCSNCHGAHDIKNVHDPRSRVSKKNIIYTCGNCHIGIERDYLEGVHGKDFLKGIKDVPVCTDCHSEHEITSPQDLNSRVYATKVAEVCSRCHDDESLARQYGFLTSRLKTYSSSFHGTASRFGETRVANCASCHGYHDIRPSNDPKSSIHLDNLPETCGNCHPGAGVNFTKGKIHVVSEKTVNKWAYFVKVFYIVLIVAIISVFLMFIAVDLFYRMSQRFSTK